jgi:hypothetical protein
LFTAYVFTNFCTSSSGEVKNLFTQLINEDMNLSVIHHCWYFGCSGNTNNGNIPNQIAQDLFNICLMRKRN